MSDCVSLDPSFDTYMTPSPVSRQDGWEQQVSDYGNQSGSAGFSDEFVSSPTNARLTVEAEGLPPGVEVAMDAEEGVPVLIVEDESALDRMLLALGGTAEAAERGQKKSAPDEDITYKVNKLTKLAWRVGFASAYVPYSQKFYLNYYSSWLENPNAAFFKGDPWLSKNLFNPASPIGRTMSKLFLPEKYRKMTDAELKKHAGEIRVSGYGAQAISSKLMIYSNVIRIAGNVGALGNCVFGDGKCDAPTAALVVSDIATSGIFSVVQKFANKGSKLTKQAEKLEGAENLLYRGKAFDAFVLYKQISRWGYGAQMATGGIRLYIEFDKWRNDD
ncbi:MAG TPA: hypothetical protein PLY45_06995, partial [bacterium]|nr:hypothetical protein [bacterium]